MKVGLPRTDGKARAGRFETPPGDGTARACTRRGAERRLQTSVKDFAGFGSVLIESRLCHLRPWRPTSPSSITAGSLGRTFKRRRPHAPRAFARPFVGATSRRSSSSEGAQRASLVASGIPSEGVRLVRFAAAIEAR
ncbi:MAG: hypothetical protein AAGG01_00845 [Planctomycetota bacterium]